MSNAQEEAEQWQPVSRGEAIFTHPSLGRIAITRYDKRALRASGVKVRFEGNRWRRSPEEIDLDAAWVERRLQAKQFESGKDLPVFT